MGNVMIKFAMNVFLFCIFLMLFYMMGLFFWGGYTHKMFQKNLYYVRGSDAFTYTKLKDVQEIEDTDILFLGSSHCYRGIDTRFFFKHDLNTFNLGTSSQTPMQTYFLLKRYLKKVNPKLIVFETFPAMLCADGVESSLDILSNDEIGWDYFLLAFKTPNAKVMNTICYAFLQQLFANNDFVEPKRSKKDSYIKGGYVQRKFSTSGYGEYQNGSWKINPEQLDFYKACISLFEYEKIEYVLIEAPMASYRYNSYSNNNKIDSVFSSLGSFKNFNGVSKLDDSLHFYDNHHLNQDGVLIFNNDLYNWLKEEHFIR